MTTLQVYGVIWVALFVLVLLFMGGATGKPTPKQFTKEQR